jgi:tripeptide aminopeptidase
MYETVLDRFLRYVKVNTRAKEDSDTYPSTPGQWDLLRMLEGEMKALGLHDVTLDRWGYCFGTLPGNSPKKVPTVAFLAHVDTSPEVSGEGVKPVLHRNYQGGDIVLPGDPAQVIKASENPNLARQIGHTIVTSDGTTLLGSDDKAGIAEIMTLVDYLLAHPEIPRGPIRVGFNPDEEVGMGTAHLEAAAVGADYAYTVDGGELGEIENETFNAAAATLTVKGFNVHPGYAKDKMVHAGRIAARFVEMLPALAAPETTAGREGYWHPLSIHGDVSEATVKMILRDFEWAGIEAKVKYLEHGVEVLRAQFPRAGIELAWKEQYRNMRYPIEKDPKVVDHAMEACRRAGVEPKLHSIRGGTDGSALTLKGLLTPNIFTGGHNFHSKQEWNSVEWMEASVRTLVEVVKIWEERS